MPWIDCNWCGRWKRYDDGDPGAQSRRIKVAIVVGIAGSVVPAVLGPPEGWDHLGDTLAFSPPFGGADCAVGYLSDIAHSASSTPKRPPQKHAGH
jgi:hypothetical protein